MIRISPILVFELLPNSACIIDLREKKRLLEMKNIRHTVHVLVKHHLPIPTKIIFESLLECLHEVFAQVDERRIIYGIKALHLPESSFLVICILTSGLDPVQYSINKGQMVKFM